MGNAVDKGKGYYGITTGASFSYTDADGFVIVTVDVAPAHNEESPPENRSGKVKTPFEIRGEPIRVGETERKNGLAGSIDSGYAEVQNVASKCNSRETSPEPIPIKSVNNEHSLVEGLSDPDCRTAKSLGNCHAFLGYRFYQYNDTDCEGNKHILDNDL